LTLPSATSLSKVCVHLGGVARIHAIDLDIQAGERVALVGPSGAGKTTLLRLIGAGLTPHTGTVSTLGENHADLTKSALRKLRSKIGFIHQDHALVLNMRVMGNVLAGRLGQQGFWTSLKSMSFPAAIERQRVLALLDEVGIGDKLYHRVDTLSGGERQRVAIARALYQNPKILLADEPVASVDPERARETMARFQTLADLHQLTLLMSLHDLELARSFFPRLIGIRQGEIVFDGPPQDLTPTIADQIFTTHQE